MAEATPMSPHNADAPTVSAVPMTPPVPTVVTAVNVTPTPYRPTTKSSPGPIAQKPKRPLVQVHRMSGVARQLEFAPSPIKVHVVDSDPAADIPIVLGTPSRSQDAEPVAPNAPERKNRGRRARKGPVPPPSLKLNIPCPGVAVRRIDPNTDEGKEFEKRQRENHESMTRYGDDMVDLEKTDIFFGSEKAGYNYTNLARHNVHQIVNCAKEVDCVSSEVPLGEMPSKSDTKIPSMKIGCEDVLGEEVLSKFWKGAYQAALCKEAGVAIFFHCRGGFSRSASFAMAAAMIVYDADLEKMRESLLQVRPGVNDHCKFFDQLEKWAVKVEKFHQATADQKANVPLSTLIKKHDFGGEDDD